MSEPATIPTPSAAQTLWAGVGLFAVGWVWELVRYWGLQFKYADRYLIVAAAAWLAYRAWPEITSRAIRQSSLGVLSVLLGAVSFPVGWFVFVQVGPRPVLVWWAYGSVLAMTVGALAVTHGWWSVRRLAFPLLFVALALPLPGRFNSPLQQRLQSGTTTVAATGLPIIGIPVVREGFVLNVPAGPPLGVVEACSGVMLFTLLTSLSLFLAYHFRLGWVRGGIMLALSVPVIVLANGARVMAMGMAQVWFDVDVTNWFLHEAIGSVELVLGFGLMYLIFVAIRPRGRDSAPIPLPAAELPAVVPVRRRADVLSCACLILGLGLTAVATTVPTLAANAGEDSIDPVADTITGRFPDGGTVTWKTDGNIPIPDTIADEMTFHRGIHRLYQDPLGHEAFVYVFHWTSATTVRGYHHPDICLPSRGFELKRKAVEPMTTPVGRMVPVTAREFANDKTNLAVTYWTQEGQRFWSDADETDAFAFTYPFQWVGGRLKPRPAGSVDDRIVVLCFAPGWATSPSGKERFLGFVAGLADEVYRVCPWADPGSAATEAASNR